MTDDRADQIGSRELQRTARAAAERDDLAEAVRTFQGIVNGLAIVAIVLAVAFIFVPAGVHFLRGVLP